MAKKMDVWRAWVDGAAQGWYWELRTDNGAVISFSDVVISCARMYKTKAGALKAARRFAAKYGIRIDWE